MSCARSVLVLALTVAAATASFPGVIDSGRAGIVAEPEVLRFATDRPRYRPGLEVVIKLVNETDATIVMQDPWRVEETKTGDDVATHFFGQDKVVVEPGEKRVWRWDQIPDVCAEPRCPPVAPGRYTAVAPLANGQELKDSFEIGCYFTLGFRRSDDTFVVFVRERKPIRQMRAEAKAEKKSLIVSGIVRREVAYNRPWSFSMGPGSIVLGEVFIEVCDANPRYVEEHKKDWMGKRWCPWSSYVKKVGR